MAFKIDGGQDKNKENQVGKNQNSGNDEYGFKSIKKRGIIHPRIIF